MLCADHGPCVSGAHNSIVTARAGKDLVSSLVSGELFDFYMQNFYPFHRLPIFTAETLKRSFIITGLLTIGPRFGGAIDDAARYFKDAYDRVSQLRFSFMFLASPCFLDRLITVMGVSIGCRTSRHTSLLKA